MGIQASFLDNLEWRRAVKHFGGGAIDTKSIENAIVQAPSSFGLQPYRVYKIQNKTTKEALRAVSYNQAQVTECHTLFVFCARSDIQTRIDEYVLATGNVAQKTMMEAFANNLKDPVAWSIRQVYIALGFALAAAAEQRIASCPMEGFQPDGVAKILDLPNNLVPCVYLAVGEWTYEEESPRFRFPQTDVLLSLDA